MTGFNAAFVNEAVKLLKRKKMIVAAILSMLAVLTGQIAVMLIKNDLGIRIAGGNEFSLLTLAMVAYTVLPLFATLVAIDMFNGEFSSDTMKLTLLRPVTRFGVFSAKVLNLAAFIFFNLMFVMIVSMLAGFLFHPASANSVGAGKVVLSYVTTFLPIFSFSLLAVLFSNVFRNGMVVLCLIMIMFIGFNVLDMMFTSYSSFFVTSMFDWYRLWISESIYVSKIVRQILIMLGWSLMLFTAGYDLFSRKDI
ncbi:ABC transporter permease [Paenibacillus sp. 481]|uniref:ABC transporter permease n=1 Tax=Paenibacillus sp. 481 TaxID=2835869 RepID=UPI001E589D50|nr:ABC transporter permease [Paenibacillus sp. 481]UHA75154.1 ABC transporter permease [Paenibacillus sp. 481]